MLQPRRRCCRFPGQRYEPTTSMTFADSWTSTSDVWRHGPFSLYSEGTMIDLYNAQTNQVLGSITEADLQVLIDALEEESGDDQDYYLDDALIALIADGRTD